MDVFQKYLIDAIRDNTKQLKRIADILEKENKVDEFAKYMNPPVTLFDDEEGEEHES